MPEYKRVSSYPFLTIEGRSFNLLRIDFIYHDEECGMMVIQLAGGEQFKFAGKETIMAIKNWLENNSLLIEPE